MIYLTLILCFICSVLLTPLVKRLAFKIGATDKPNNRKVHEKVMPRLGGLAIYLSFMLGVLIFSPNKEVHIPIMVGAFIIVIIGMLDDKYQLPAKYKLIGQIAAALIVVFWGNVEVEFINNPFFGDNRIDFGYFAIPITILWIVGVTNAINLIDGLDGLAAGVSSIALFTIAGMAVFMGNTYVIAMASLLMVATLGFLVFNFHPAKIFMGDTGALFFRIYDCCLVIARL